MTTMSFEQDFASEQCLKAYYDQLPTETAPFSVDAYTADDNLPTYGHNIDAEPSQQFPDFGFSAQNTQEPVVQAQPDLLSHSDILHPEPAIVEEIRETDFGLKKGAALCLMVLSVESLCSSVAWKCLLRV